MPKSMWPVICLTSVPGFWDHFRKIFPSDEPYREDKPINDPELGVPEVVQFLKVWKDKATIRGACRFCWYSLQLPSHWLPQH